MKERPSLPGGKIAALVDAVYGKEHIHIFFLLKRCFQHFATVSFVSIMSNLHNETFNPTSVIQPLWPDLCMSLLLDVGDGDGCSDGGVDGDWCQASISETAKRI